ncbi:MAG TPA: class I SAM-dependent methyltransferase [Candidatus Limnocylindrales bacterium]|nr:class I SAM-dependent methyltransferase [Candidatus Limnocylindrales bacterium]
MTDELLREQVRYYRARAPEYDRTSRPPDDPFADLTGAAVADLHRLGPVERAIELGAGTGQWTGQVAAIAREVIAVDAAPETLDLNAANVRASNVARVVADAFEFTPDRPADLVVFSALLSHIPSARFDAFWEAIGRMLTTTGRVWLFDESPHGLWREEWVTDPEHEVVERTLEDGRRFRIVKVLWDASDLAARLEAIGWRASLVRRDPFYWGTVTPQRD